MFKLLLASPRQLRNNTPTHRGSHLFSSWSNCSSDLNKGAPSLTNNPGTGVSKKEPVDRYDKISQRVSQIFCKVSHNETDDVKNWKSIIYRKRQEKKKFNYVTFYASLPKHSVLQYVTSLLRAKEKEGVDMRLPLAIWKSKENRIYPKFHVTLSHIKNRSKSGTHNALHSGLCYYFDNYISEQHGSKDVSFNYFCDMELEWLVINQSSMSIGVSMIGLNSKEEPTRSKSDQSLIPPVDVFNANALHVTLSVLKVNPASIQKIYQTGFNGKSKIVEGYNSLIDSYCYTWKDKPKIKGCQFGVSQKI